MHDSIYLLKDGMGGAYNSIWLISVGKGRAYWGFLIFIDTQLLQRLMVGNKYTKANAKYMKYFLLAVLWIKAKC